jgi:hypothetical protein
MYEVSYRLSLYRLKTTSTRSNPAPACPQIHRNCQRSVARRWLPVCATAIGSRVHWSRLVDSRAG